MNKILFLFATSVLVVASASELKNSSNIKYSPIKIFPKSYGVHKPDGANKCKGTISEEKVKNFPWIVKELPNGIDCIPADFDGNGFIDFALLKTGWTKDESGIETTEIIALMYDKTGPKNVLMVSNKASVFSLMIYRPSNSKGRYGEPATKNPGLVDVGEGGTTTVWLFKKGKFEFQTFASEDH